jgi:8-oxo-dGTP diphosphatase
VNKPHRLVYARTLCFVEHEGRVLMLRGAPAKRLYANLYNGLGGHVEAGEDVLESVRREVREEAGIELESVRLRAVVNVDEEAGPGVMVFVFLAASPSGQARASDEGTLEWVSPAELMKLDLVEDLRQALPMFLDKGNPGVWFGRFGFDAAGGLVSLQGQWSPTC